MNRFKKEIRKRGIKLESDYPELPYYVKGKSCFEPGYICIESVFVNSETATVTEFYNVGVDKLITMKRNGKLETLI